MYGSEVLFIDKEISDFEMVHLLFFNNMLGVKQQTTSGTILKQQILALKY